MNCLRGIMEIGETECMQENTRNLERLKEKYPAGQRSAMKRQQGSDHEALDPFLSTFHSILLATEYRKTGKKEGGYSICC